MANFRKRGEPGRFTKGPNALTEQLYARVTLTQLAAFARLGGAAWLRQQIDAAVAADRDLPTPNRPFPAAGPGGHAPDLQHLRGRSSR